MLRIACILVIDFLITLNYSKTLKQIGFALYNLYAYMVDLVNEIKQF